jgi:hypothetical protein
MTTMRIFSVFHARSGSANLNSVISRNYGHKAGPRKVWREEVSGAQEISATHSLHPHGHRQSTRNLCGLLDDKTMTELCKQFELHPNQIADWKWQLLGNAANVFGGAVEYDAPVDL